nr:sigma 54-interacting transcriptional regulator [SAR86 cluster bacterium]
KAEIIGEAPAMQEVFRAIGKLSNSNSTVLLVGQTGTGKELVAQALFQHSPRKEKAFIALNMADIPKELLEAELFGHEKGAFTGADEKRIGRFEQANEGTLFLDEIGDMPLETQTRLLRVLSNGEFYRVGGRKPITVDVRIIAATHQSLEEQVEKKVFREDLFHRLNVIKISLPILSERRADIPALSKHFLKISALELNEEVKFLSEEVEDYFSRLSWPGNVRQLENACRWLTVMAPSRQIKLEDLPADLKSESTESKAEWTGTLKSWAEDSLEKGETELLNLALPEFEKTMIEAALDKTMGKKNEAAKLLGWGRNTLTRKIKDLGMT